jgi:predicted TIM-barrel fold metal-dependent hydrolase
MIVDVHTHIFPPAMIAHRERLAASDAGFAALYGDPSARMATVEELVESMDAAGVDAAVAAGFWWASDELAEEHSRYLLDAATAHPGRVLPFLPQLDPPEGATGIGEVRETDERGLVGARLPLLVHCSEGVGHAYPGKTGGLSPDALWRLVEALGEAVEDAPPVIAAHWGGGFPFYGLMPEVRAAVEDGRLLFDSAASAFLYDPAIFEVTLDLVGAGAICWGSDFPLRDQRRDREEARQALASASEADRHAIFGGNAARLLGLAENP